MNDATKTLLSYKFWKLESTVQAVKDLLNEGGYIHARDKNRQTPLHWAAAHGSAEIVKYLIDAGAGIKARDFLECIPLHWAARFGTIEAINALIDAGSDINARDYDGYTPAELVQNNRKLDGTDALTLLAAHVKKGKNHD